MKTETLSRALSGLSPELLAPVYETRLKAVASERRAILPNFSLKRALPIAAALLLCVAVILTPWGDSVSEAGTMKPKRGWFSVIAEDYPTWEEIQAIPAFSGMFPTYLPDGFRLTSSKRALDGVADFGVGYENMYLFMTFSNVKGKVYYYDIGTLGEYSCFSELSVNIENYAAGMWRSDDWESFYQLEGVIKPEEITLEKIEARLHYYEADEAKEENTECRFSLSVRTEDYNIHFSYEGDRIEAEELYKVISSFGAFGLK